MGKTLKIALQIVVLVVWVLVLLEGGLRVMSSKYQLPNRVPADIFAAHEIGWYLEPNLNVGIASGSGVIKIETNEAGFRDKNYPVEKPADKRRILVLGDSYTLALETPQNEVFHVQLEELYGGQVISFGVSGYELLQYYLVYQHLGAKYQPDEVVILLFIGNDIRGNLRWEHLPHYTLENGKLALHHYPYKGEFDLPLVTTQRSTPLMRHSMLAFTLGIITRHNQNLTKASDSNLGFCDYWGSISYPQPTEEDWELSESLILALRDAVEADGGKLRVAIIPGELQVEPTDFAIYQSQCEIPDQEAAMQNHLIQFFEANSIAYLDLLPILKNARESGENRLYLEGDDIHWTIEGHTVVAQALYEFLQDY